MADTQNGQEQEEFFCQNCKNSLIGQKYILQEEKPHCLKCYEDLFTNVCDACKTKISCDAKDLSFKDKHWHEKCFYCCVCQNSLAEKPFAMKDDQIYCTECHDEKFSQRCDGCNKIFKAGSKKYEYKGTTWHEECFTCKECKEPMGSKSFIPKDDGVVCVPCYDDKYSQKCVKCTKPIQKGGLTYKGSPWHKECFLCVKCGNQLAGQKFTSKDEQPYCAECYANLFANKCATCDKPITGFGGCRFVTFEDKHWHSDCFNCVKCNESMVGKGFIVTAEGVTCPNCVNKQ